MERSLAPRLVVVDLQGRWLLVLGRDARLLDWVEEGEEEIDVAVVAGSPVIATTAAARAHEDTGRFCTYAAAKRHTLPHHSRQTGTFPRTCNRRIGVYKDVEEDGGGAYIFSTNGCTSLAVRGRTSLLVPLQNGIVRQICNCQIAECMDEETWWESRRCLFVLQKQKQLLFSPVRKRPRLSVGF